jgi:hypothetical protein
MWSPQVSGRHGRGGRFNSPLAHWFTDRNGAQSLKYGVNPLSHSTGLSTFVGHDADDSPTGRR